MAPDERAIRLMAILDEENVKELSSLSAPGKAKAAALLQMVPAKPPNVSTQALDAARAREAAWQSALAKNPKVDGKERADLKAKILEGEVDP